jgi:D-alanyl-D-alanine carboxypeptidase
MEIRFLRFALLVTLVFGVARVATAEAAEAQERQQDGVVALIKAYPDFLDRIDGNDLVWKDGTRMPVDDGKGAKPFEVMLDDPDIKDMFATTYPAGDKGLAPEVNFDPGRIRYLPLFTKMYGDCRKMNLVTGAGEVVWLRKKYGKTIKFSKINGAAAQLQKVSDELDQLPDRFLEYLRPLQGTFNCRPIAGTDRPSAHGLGIAIDLAEAHSHYWLWSKSDASGRVPYKNEIPWEIVRIFEKHGFIWGGKWYHYDTMHFEYRPEILLNAK